MSKTSVKVFRDPVHGYIEVPSVIVKNIIDTEQFQRLKFIEQTAMRALFPAARHDRFIHSLGTYWLGAKAFKGFRKNSTTILDELKTKKLLTAEQRYRFNENWWKKYELLFQLACLMHDCAHAPFSHTLEDYYTIPRVSVKGNKRTRLSWLLCSFCNDLGDDTFENDFYSNKPIKGIGKAHEQMSSYIILSDYLDAIRVIFRRLRPRIKLDDKDFVFICRSIIGCKYSEESLENSLKNCIISLLNSELIDVDGLDYIVRDAQMSGMSAYDIDYQRILNSFTIIPVFVYKSVCCDKQVIDGLWLKGSSFNAKNSERLTINTAATLTTPKYRDRLEGFQCISADTYNFEPEPEKDIYIARADRVPDFSLVLLKSGRLSRTMFSGTIVNGKKVIEDYGSAKESLPISFVLAYDKRCLSIIQNTINARNDEYLWVYSHPKVMYCSNYLQCELLRLSAKYLCCKCNRTKKDNSKLTFDCKNCRLKKKDSRYTELYINQILGYDFLFDENDCKIKEKLQKKNFIFYRTNDDDLNSLFKRIKLENALLGENKSDMIEKVSKEYFNRNHRSVLWKSFAEYTAIYMMLDDSSLHRNFEDLFERYEERTDGESEKYVYLDEEDQKLFDEQGFKDSLLIFGKANTKAIQVSEFLVKYEDRVEQLCKLFPHNMERDNSDLQLKFIFVREDDEWNHQTIKALNDSLGARVSASEDI